MEEDFTKRGIHIDQVYKQKKSGKHGEPLQQQAQTSKMKADIPSTSLKLLRRLDTKQNWMQSEELRSFFAQEVGGSEIHQEALLLPLTISRQIEDNANVIHINQVPELSYTQVASTSCTIASDCQYQNPTKTSRLPLKPCSPSQKVFHQDKQPYSLPPKYRKENKNINPLLRDKLKSQEILPSQPYSHKQNNGERFRHAVEIRVQQILQEKTWSQELLIHLLQPDTITSLLYTASSFHNHTKLQHSTNSSLHDHTISLSKQKNSSVHSLSSLTNRKTKPRQRCYMKNSFSSASTSTILSPKAHDNISHKQ